MATCINCGNEGDGKFCSECSQPYIVKRITFGGILHEVTHTFTHLDKGFGYTLKQLATSPGKMQKRYLEGHRMKYQKPFSMFFICTTITGLVFYWIGTRSTHSAVDESRNFFFRNYFVFLQVLLLPFYTFLLWMFFRTRKYFYAEILTMQIYTISFLFLLLIPINLINQIPPHRFPTNYAEISVLALYTIWTNLNFFNDHARWKVIIKSLIVIVIGWFTSTMIADRIVHWMA